MQKSLSGISSSFSVCTIKCCKFVPISFIVSIGNSLRTTNWVSLKFLHWAVLLFKEQFVWRPTHSFAISCRVSSYLPKLWAANLVLYSPGVLKFLFLLLDATVDLLADLGQLQLAAQHLVLLLLESCLSLFQSGLQFIFLNLQTLPGLLDLMDVSATLTNLVQQVFDLIWKPERKK